MINIGVASEHKVWLNTIYEYIKEYLEYRKIACEISKNIDMSDVESLEKYDLLFLDIELENGINGISIAKELKKRNPEERLVLLSANEKHFTEGYYVNAYRFIDKKKIDDIKEALGSFFKELRMMEMISLRIKKDREIKTPLHSILYFSIEGRNVHVHLRNREVLAIDDNLDDIYERYGEKGLIKVQRSYVANIAAIRRLEPRFMIMADGEEISIGRKHVNNVRNEIIKWNIRYS